MLNLDGYQEKKQIYAGTRTIVYQALEIATRQPVIIKVLRNSHPNFNELVQFRNQYIITRHLQHPAIVQPLALERYGNGYALVMPEEGEISLIDYWQHSEHSQKDFLNIAIQLASALHYLNQKRIIHKDIKPANILIHPKSKHIKLIDFSISSLLPTEQQQLINPNVLEGTLGYISPEQTGRMNRGIDYRTDFYSLGITFFELLSGKLPFQSNDPMEVVHCHIAQTVSFPIENDVPQVLQNIVLKLMAKNAEDRYQSALGLKHDLEQCLQQLEIIGKITSFELGERDKSDRFLIPEKLYGRETEVQTLLDAFERVAYPTLSKGGKGRVEMILVAGFSGIGKTAVIKEVHKPIVRQRGYFIKGKFDQFNRNIPFSAFVQAFRDLMSQLLGESDEELALWKGKILDAVGENGQVIIDVVPEVERIIGSQPAVPELSGSAAQNRFNLLFNKFVRVFTTKEHPLVIFLDDLQWADSASLSLLRLLMDESEVGYLLVLGAYRDNEVFPAHPLMLTFDEIRQEGAKLETITLAPLSEKDITRLVAETLLCSRELAAPLSQLVYQKTKGNPFFSTQFLKGLHEDGCITFNMEAGYWQCDLSEVRQLALTDDVVEFMVGRLQKLPEANQNVMKLAACIGNQFDLAILAVVCEQTQDEVAGNLWRGLQEGFVIPQTDTYKFFQGELQQDKSQENISVNYRFLHDRVQQAAYSLIPEGRKQATHLQIGRLLSQNLSPEEQDTNIFTIVNHWNQGIELIADSTEKENLIQLNLKSGEKAKGSAAYGAALQYFQTAISLLDVESWQTNYPLALKLHENYAEAAYLTGDFELMETIIEKVFNHRQDLLDLVKIHEIKIQAEMAQTQQLSALNIGIDFLGLLGIEVPESPHPQDLQVEIAAISQLMEGKAIADLANLPLMQDGKQLAKVRILASLLPTCYQVKPSLFPWVVCKLMQLSIKYGNTVRSSLIYSCYSMVCILALQHFTSATEYGKLACQLDLSPQTGDGVNGNYVTGACINHYSTHVKESLPLLLKAYQTGLETGNFHFGGYAISNRSQYIYLTGHNLSAVKLEMATASHALATMKQENILAWNQIFEQAVLNLLGESETLWELIGTAYNETESVPFQIAAKDRTALHYVYLNKLIICYLFDLIPQAVENAALAESYLDGVACFLDEYACNFYASLTQLANYGDTDTSVQKSILEKVENNQNKMQYWANHAPMNAQHKVDLVAAECHRVLGRRFEAIDLYDQAIAGAQEYEYLQEEALANELAAKFYLDWGKEKVAAGYMQEAYYCYARWGAKAKTDDLEKRYAQLLQPIFQQTVQPNSAIETLASIAQPKLSIHSSITTSLSSTRGINTALDFASVLKSSQALSEIIQLDELLHELIQIILQNSGGDRCILLIPDDNSTWQIGATATHDTIVLCTEALAGNTSLPVKLIQYVKNTKEVLVIDRLDTDLPILDDYLNQHQPQSVLCLPMLNQTKLVGIMYIQNQSTRGVFTGDRILILNFLCHQAAISIKNAQLHQKSELSLQEVKQSQHLLRKIIDTIPQMVFWKDRDSNYLGCNQKFATMAGVNSPEDIVGKTDYDLPWSREEADLFREYDRRVMESNQAELHIIETQQQVDGTTLWLDTNKMPLCDETGEVHGILGSYEDISERKQLEQEQKRLNTILEASSDYIGLTDIQGNALWINHQFMQLCPEQHGDRPQQLKISDFHPQWVNEIIFNQAIPTAIKQGTWIGELAVLDATGREIPVSHLLIAHKSAQGEVEYFSTIMRDISQKKEAEAALIEKSQALEQALQDLQTSQLQIVQSEKMSALGSLMAGVAHEINNPLGFIGGNIELAQENLADLLEHLALHEQGISTEDLAYHAQEIDLEYLRADFPNILESMNVGVERMKDISNSLRIFSRKDQEYKTAFNIHDGIESTLTILKHRTKASEQRPQIQIIADYEELPEINCFPGQLSQVFMNILANAIDAFDEANEGKTYAEIEKNPNRIVIRTSMVENQVKIEIEDNGNGMKPETKDRIFEYGFTTKDVGKGTGLGMAIAYQIITDKHSGKITCDSTLGKGTIFTIRISIL